MRSREYDPATGTFLTKDSWQGNDTTPMSYNTWLYADANPLNLTDPSGHDPSGTKKYDRDAAAKYAISWADSENPAYKDFGDADCTNFASQALYTGGLEERFPSWWYYSLFGFPLYGRAWINTDALHDFLTKTEGFTEQKVPGTIPYSQDGISGERIPDKRINSSDPPFILPGGAQDGDIVFYYQKDSAEVRKGAHFNHAGVIVDPDGPKMVDHSDPNRQGKEVINETKGEVDELVVVHIPDDIPSSSSLGCISPIVSSYLPYLQ